MNYTLLCYHGNLMETTPIDTKSSVLLGNTHLCPGLDSVDFAGVEIRLDFTNGEWQLSKGKGCRKNVDFPVGAVKQDHVFVLDRSMNLAIEITCNSEIPMATLPLVDVKEIGIGRGVGNTIRFNTARVSSNHAKLSLQNGQWRLDDLHSANGTWLNGVRIASENLKVGDVIWISKFKILFTGKSLDIYTNTNDVTLAKSSSISNYRNGSKSYPYYSLSPRFIEKMPTDEIEIEAAPTMNQKPEINWVSVLLTSLGSFAVMAVVTLLSPAAGMMLMLSGPMMLISLFVAVYNYRTQVKRYKERQILLSKKYGEYLKCCNEKAESFAQEQRRIMLEAHPSPDECVQIAKSRSRKLWERNPSDEDFMSFRIGIGPAPATFFIKTPKLTFTLDEDIYREEPKKIAQKFKKLDGLPITFNFLTTPTCGVVGEQSTAEQIVRNMVIQMATHNNYNEVKIVTLFSEKEKEKWDWIRWLPHSYDENHQLRYMACTSYEAASMLTEVENILKQRVIENDLAINSAKQIVSLPFFLFIIADAHLLENQPISDILFSKKIGMNAGTIFLAGTTANLPRTMSAVIEADTAGGQIWKCARADEVTAFTVDHIDLKTCEDFARSLAPVSLPETSGQQSLPTAISFLQGYRAKRVESLDLNDYWKNACAWNSMSVPIGIRANGEFFSFDIADGHDGPHGLVAGMTGSGKSEMIQSWILSMAVQFSPQDVSFVLIDFKGTGLILPFANLPHIAGTISDLDVNINRNLLALEAELQRRKELFDRAGVTKITDYQKLYRANRVPEPLSYLFVVIDEYAEFKAKFPDFSAEINTLFRTGRSMGVHIIVATQNPSGIISTESESNVKFRWCLKVANSGASKEVLGGHAEAAKITVPGRAYVRVGDDERFELIQSFWSGAPYDPERQQNSAPQTIHQVNLRGERHGKLSTAESKVTSSGISEINAVVEYIHDHAQRSNTKNARKIWLPRLPETIYLPDLLADFRKEETDELLPIVGLIDDPASQSQYPLCIPLSSRGHTVIYGAPSMGKTTLLHTMITSLCLCYTPDHVNLYLLDFGSMSLSRFRDFPQVAAVANTNDEELILQITQMLEATLQKRKEDFSRQGVGTLQAYRHVSKEPTPYIVLIIDNFAPVLSVYPQLESFFIRLTSEGGNYGIYLVATTNSFNGIGYRLQNNVGSKLALWMTDRSAYSEIVGRTNGLEPEYCPGSGLIHLNRVLAFQAALPARGENEKIRTQTIKTLAKRAREAWQGHVPSEAAALQNTLTFGSIIVDKGLPVGINLSNHTPAVLSFDNSHLLAISYTQNNALQGGMSALLREIAQEQNVYVYLYGRKLPTSAVNQGNVQMLSNGAAVDACLSEVAETLKARKAKKDADSSATFSPCYVILDRFKQCFDEMSQDSYNRLQALIYSGSGLGVRLIVSDFNTTLNSFMELAVFLKDLAEQQLICSGGSLIEHHLAPHDISPAKRTETMRSDEAYLFAGEELVKYKAMTDKESEKS